jgi:hypothetical protein
MTYDDGNKYYTNEIVDDFKRYMTDSVNQPTQKDSELYDRIPETQKTKDEQLLRDVIDRVRTITREEKEKLDDEREAEEAAETEELLKIEERATNNALKKADKALKKADEATKKEIRETIKSIRAKNKSSHKATYDVAKKKFEAAMDSIGYKNGRTTGNPSEGGEKIATEAAEEVLRVLDNDEAPEDDYERATKPVGTGLKQLLSDEHTVKIVEQHQEYKDYTSYIEEQSRQINKGYFTGLTLLRNKVDSLIAEVNDYLDGGYE